MMANDNSTVYRLVLQRDKSRKTHKGKLYRGR